MIDTERFAGEFAAKLDTSTLLRYLGLDCQTTAPGWRLTCIAELIARGVTL
jgi:hypothetical protein